MIRFLSDSCCKTILSIFDKRRAGLALITRWWTLVGSGRHFLSSSHDADFICLHLAAILMFFPLFLLYELPLDIDFKRVKGMDFHSV